MITKSIPRSVQWIGDLPSVLRLLDQTLLPPAESTPGGSGVLLVQKRGTVHEVLVVLP